MKRRSKFIIHPMRRKDGAAMSKLMKGLQAFHGDRSRVTARHFIEHCLGPNKSSLAWIAYVGDQPAGFAVSRYWMNFLQAQKVCTLDMLHVEEAFRGCGIGYGLIAEVVRDALRQDVQRLDVGAMKTNRVANKYYRKLGFEKLKSYAYRYKIEGKKLECLTSRKQLA